MISKDNFNLFLIITVLSILNYAVLLSEKWIDLFSYKKLGMVSKIRKSFACETLAIIAVYLLYVVYMFLLVVLFETSGQLWVMSLIFTPLLLSVAIPTFLFVLERTGVMSPFEPKPSIFTVISNVILSLGFDVAYGWAVAWYFLSDLEFEILGNGKSEPIDHVKTAKFIAFTVALVVITIVIKAIIQWIIAKISAKRQQQTLTEAT